MRGHRAAASPECQRGGPTEARCQPRAVARPCPQPECQRPVSPPRSLVASNPGVLRLDLSSPTYAAKLRFLREVLQVGCSCCCDTRAGPLLSHPAPVLPCLLCLPASLGCPALPAHPAATLPRARSPPASCQPSWWASPSSCSTAWNASPPALSSSRQGAVALWSPHAAQPAAGHAAARLHRRCCVLQSLGMSPVRSMGSWLASSGARRLQQCRRSTPEPTLTTLAGHAEPLFCAKFAKCTLGDFHAWRAQWRDSAEGRFWLQQAALRCDEQPCEACGGGGLAQRGASL